MQWQWLSPGSVGATLVWLAATAGFGIYVANFGSYDATYGSLGAALVLLTWLYLSAYILLLGAEVNCELERQTAKDTTSGPDAPLGARGAHVADTVAGEHEMPAERVGPSDDPDQQVATGAQHSELKSYMAARATNRIGRMVGLQKVGIMSSVLAMSGLALLRRQGRARAGVVLLSIGGALSWATRRD